MKLGCCTWNFFTEFPSPPDEAIAQIAEMGFDGFELIVLSTEELRDYYTPARVRHLRNNYESQGLLLSRFAIGSYPLQALAQFEPENQQSALDAFALGATVARDLGADLVSFVPAWPEGLVAPHQYLPLYIHPAVNGALSTAGPTWRLDLPESFVWSTIWDNYVRSLEACVSIAAEAEVRLALEGHPLTILSNTDSFLRLFDQMPAPQLGVNLDMAMQAAIHREYPPISIHKLGQKLFHVHARDTDGALNYSVPVGSGILDWPAIIKSLQQIGFDGFISIELGENCREPERYVRQAKAYLDTILAETDD
ncbi:sugar phosphate isomerase/epimerase [Chloroflexi bacterium TSY]|nr:sugar phosphate isomerase/epimerase [Chloroflexi bacterium TSY]